MHHFVIKELVENDLRHIVDTFVFPWSSIEATEEKWKRYLKEHQRLTRTIYVLSVQGKIIGYGSLLRESQCLFFQKNRVPEINDVWILEAFRSKGFGKTLILHIETAAKKEGFTKIGIGVGLYSDYGIAQKLYARLRFIPTGQGATYKGQPVEPGKTYPMDDDLVLYLEKILS